MNNSQTLAAFSLEGSWASCFGYKTSSLKTDVAVSDFESAFALFCVRKQPWENMGCGQGLQTDRAISLMLCVLVTYAAIQEFSLATPVRQENLWWSQVCPFTPSFCLWKHAVTSLWGHKRRWLRSQCQAAFQGALLVLLLSFWVFFWEMHS